MPVVSVIIPTYNRAEMVREAIQSILDQNYTDYEIIVVDDGSTDNTRDVVTAFRDYRIRYIYQENRGRSNARNHAIRLAQGKYIAFLDSDDLFLPHTLATQVNCLERNQGFGMVYSSAKCINEKGEDLLFSYEATESGWIYRQIAFYRPLTIILPSIMIRGQVLTEVGYFDENLERFEDTDMFRRISRRYPILAIPETLCKIRAHSSNILESQDPEEILSALDYYVNKVFSLDRDVSLIFRRKGAAKFYLYYGWTFINYLKWHGIGRKFLHRSIRYWPFDIKAYITYMMILLAMLHLESTVSRLYMRFKGRSRT